MRHVWLVVVLVIACKHAERERNADGVPLDMATQLVFRERRVPLQPDDRVVFTLRVPTVWEQDRMLTKDIGGRPQLVNGAGEVVDRWRYHTAYGDPELHDGFFELAISCEGDCAKQLEQHIFAQYVDDEVLRDEQTPTGHWMIARNDKSLYVLRVWWLPNEPSFRSCWVRIGKKYQDAAPAFEKACADVVESFEPPR